MKAEILSFILENTNRSSLETYDTKFIANKFKITTAMAYNILKSLSDDKKILHLDPVNDNNFSYADWCRLFD